MHQGANGSLAVGTGHLNGGKAPFGMPQRGQGTLQTIKPKINPPPAEGLNQIGKRVVHNNHGAQPSGRRDREQSLLEAAHSVTQLSGLNHQRRHEPHHRRPGRHQQQALGHGGLDQLGGC